MTIFTIKILLLMVNEHLKLKCDRITCEELIEFGDKHSVNM